jgi:hypothetical protein
MTIMTIILHSIILCTFLVQFRPAGLVLKSSQIKGVFIVCAEPCTYFAVTEI